MQDHKRPALIAMLSLVVIAACQRTEPPATRPTPVLSPAPAAAATAKPAAAPFKVSSVEVGKAVGADKRVTSPTTAFGANDTIYASVLTEGSAPSVVLKARWTYQDGQLVDESSQTIASTGPAATEFHISKPSGWPAGKYKVEISADGKVVATREFDVTA